MKERNKKVISFILIFMLGLLAGYIFGFSKGVEWTIHYGLQFTTIDIDEDLLVAGVLQYKNNIAGCFERRVIKDGSFIYDDEGD